MKARNLISAVAGMIIKVVVVVLVIFFVYRGATAAYDYGYRVFMEPAMSAGEGRAVTVTITKGMSPAEMGQLLFKKGLIKDPKLFTLQYWLSEFRKDIRPGEYELTTAMTAEEMMEVMATHPEETEESQEGGAPASSGGEDDTGGAEDAGEDDAGEGSPEG